MKEKPGYIPIITVKGRTLPEVWEKAVVRTWRDGAKVKTQYDKEGDPPSRDATVIMEVSEPFGEPRIHRSFPAGLEELEIYRLEVVEGIHDSWIDPAAGKWTYTYHHRLFNYNVVDNVDNGIKPGHFKEVDQIQYIIDSLSECYYSRRAQAITWMPTADLSTEDPPCLQRIWCRILEENGRKYLNMNTHWRSRDGYKASFMNIFGLTDLQRKIAQAVSEKIGEEVRVGRYVDISDSFHIYGSYFEDFNKRFLSSLEARSYRDRVWDSGHDFIQDSFTDGRLQLINGKPNEPTLDMKHLISIYTQDPLENAREKVKKEIREAIEKKLDGKRGG